MHHVRHIPFVIFLNLPLAFATAVDITDAASFVQVQSQVSRRSHSGKSMGVQEENHNKDLVFMHMPFNFGNTIEKVAMFSPNASRMAVVSYVMSFSGYKSFAQSDPAHIPSWKTVNNLTQAGGQVWGHFNPDLQVKSNITKCPLYLSPPKYWPPDVAKKYFGSKKVFGVVRDPYEKLVAQFRGAMGDYGSPSAKANGTLASCDVNTAVKGLLKKLLADGDMFQGGCTNIPQAEFFEGPYGISLPVDNWRFPQSANEVFEQYGYPWHIRKEDILHVWHCNNSWTADFDIETRGLVKKLYKKDFDLICKHFGHCNADENTCIEGVHGMCPSSKFTWDAKKELYCPSPGVDMKNTRVRHECLVSTPEIGNKTEEANTQDKSAARSFFPNMCAVALSLWTLATMVNFALAP